MKQALAVIVVLALCGISFARDRRFVTHTKFNGASAKVMEGTPATVCAEVNTSAPDFNENGGTFSLVEHLGNGTITADGPNCFNISDLSPGYATFQAFFSGYSVPAQDGTGTWWYSASASIRDARVAVGTTAPFGALWAYNLYPYPMVSLENLGQSDFAVSSVSITGGYTIVRNECANGVKANTHCNVFYTATTGGEGTMVFEDSAVNSPQTISF
jgi:hypothetical protein